MQLSSRKIAQAAGLGQYFTGQPCKYGHVTHRYTQSGACAACVAAAAAMTRVKENPRRDEMVADQAARLAAMQAEKAARVAAVLAERDARTAALNQLVEIRLRAFVADLPLVRDTVAAVGTSRYPMLSAAEFAAQGRPTDHGGGTALYRFRVAPDDVELLRGVANALLGTHKVDLSHVYRHVAAQVERLATDAADETPDGRK